MTCTGVPAIVTDVVRCDAVRLAATDTVIIALPVPDVVLNVTHGTELWSDHVQLAPVVTHTFANDAPAPTLTAVGDTEKVQPPDWMTVNVRPAIVTAPLLGDVPVCSSIASVAVPGPLPFAPSTIEIHDSVDVAVHGQSAVAETPTGTVDAEEPTDTPVLESVELHVLPVCDTEIQRLPTVMMPLRPNAFGFDATEYCTVPSPSPEPDVTVIHGTLLVALHGQPGPDATENEALVAAALSVTDVGESVTVQTNEPCVTTTDCPATVSVAERADVVVLAVTL